MSKRAAGGGETGGGETGEVARRKTAIRDILTDLAAVADEAGLPSTAKDIRETRLPKLDEERFSLVVLGEFNHGKSTFINALLGEALLPTGITPTTAVLSHVSYGARPSAEAVLESGERKKLDPKKLGDWLTVDGVAARAGSAGKGGKDANGGDASGIHHVELHVPSPLLKDNVTIVDTPGVNDINQQRAEITYGYLPRADACVFLLDGTQILTASERQFLEERILKSSRERLVFVVAKIDLLDERELDETLRFARKHLAAIVPAPAVFPVSAKRALAGDRARSGLDALTAHLGATLGADRRRLLLDHALADATRLGGFVRSSLGMRQRSLELPPPELEERVARARARLNNGRRALDEAAETIRAESAGLKARVRQDLADFAADFRAALPPDIEAAAAEDIRKYLPFFIQDTWKAWAEAEGERIAAELERLAEKVVQVANENTEETTRAVSSDLGIDPSQIAIHVDTLKYDASVFALGALGTTIFLFVNSMVGGLMALAAPLLAVILRGQVSKEVKAEALLRAPEAVDRVAGALGPKLDEAIDGFANRLSEFVAQAGEKLARGISEVLDRALSERRKHTDDATAGAEAADIGAALARLRAIDERIGEVRQGVWTDPS